MTRNRRRTTTSAASVDLPAKVIDFFKAHPDEVLSARDVATKFGVAAAQVDTLLEATVEAGQLKRQNTGQHGLVYMAAVRRAAFPEPSTDRLRKAMAAGRRARRAATRIDLSKVKIERGVPIFKARPRSEEWAELFRRLSPGDSFAVPSIAHDALSHAKCQFAKKEPSWRFTIRKIDDDQTRIWRVK